MTSTAGSFVPATTDGKKHRVRIDYIDGIRGLAALAVVILHLFESFGLDMEWAGIITDGRLTDNPLDRFIPVLQNITTYGAYAVEVFIVISGYSLMLAIARSESGTPKGGLKGYFRRRVRRIWPPYYGALFLSLLVIAVIPGMNVKQNLWWDQALPAFTPDVLLSHLFFLHHLSPEWLQKINPPMWTIAVEETIYILFPFVLLPFWRRFSGVAMAFVGIVVGSLSWYLFYPILQVANPWYLGLFALGALGASISFSSRPREQAWRQRIPWTAVSIVAFVIFLALDILSKKAFVARIGFDIYGSAPWLVDTMLGVSVAALLIRLTELWKTQEHNGEKGALRLLEFPAILKLGTFSYSLYLIHSPIIGMLALLAVNWGLVSWGAYGFMLLVGIPACIAGSYLFHLVFERPFMPTYLAKTQPEPRKAPANTLNNPSGSATEGRI